MTLAADSLWRCGPERPRHVTGRPASRLADYLIVHHTPKHGSWPDMAGTGTSVPSRQCLDRRIPDRGTMVREVAAWQRRRNGSAKPVDWRFRTDDARIRLKSLYPAIQ